MERGDVRWGDAERREPDDAAGYTLSYDAENRLATSKLGGGGQTTYAYDGEGRRVMKSAGGKRTVYAYGAGGALAAEYSEQGNTESGTRYVASDHLGSTRMVTDPAGEAKECHDYLPFGEEIGAAYRPDPCYQAGSVRLKFTGKERDSETGLDYFGARYFSGAQGRFTSPDPITTLKLEDPQRWNKYAYARGNPLVFVDPTGMYNTTCKSKDVTQCSAEIQAFETRRQRDLNSEDKRVRRAAKGYGSFNDGNNVQVKFDPAATQGSAPQDRDASGAYKNSFTVTLPTADAATSMVAHEGSHLADELDAMNGANALTLLQSEIRAYQTEAATMLDDADRSRVGHQMNFPNNMTLYVPWSDLIDNVNADSIRQFLAVNPAYKATQQKNEGGPVYVKPPKK